MCGREETREAKRNKVRGNAEVQMRGQEADDKGDNMKEE